MRDPQTSEDWLPTRRSLLSRLKNWEDHESWQDFFDTYWKLLYSVAVRSGLSEAEAQDAVQETIISVAKQMPGFKYDPALGSFKSWLRLLARRRIADHLRRRYRRGEVAGERAEDGLEAAGAEGPPELEALWEEEWERHLLDTALARLRRKVAPGQYQIFECHVLKGWPVPEVMRVFGVSASQVYVVKYRVGTQLKKEIEKVRSESEK